MRFSDCVFFAFDRGQSAKIGVNLGRGVDKRWTKPPFLQGASTSFPYMRRHVWALSANGLELHFHRIKRFQPRLRASASGTIY